MGWLYGRLRLSVPAATVLAILGLAVSVQAGPAVTVYSGDLGFIRETRTLDLRGSKDTLRLEGLPKRLDFASLRMDPGSGRVTRFARRFDLASGDAVLDLALGQRVSAMLRGERLVEGTLLSADGAWLVVQEETGALHTLSRTSVDDLRVMSGLPTFAIRPTVEVVIDGARRGRSEAQLSYLTGGLNWSAEHTVVRRGETHANWSAAVTIDNQSGRDYEQATLKLVAGQPHRALPPPMPYAKGRAAMAMEVAAEADLSQQTFGEYHLYTLGRPATLRDQESQQLVMLEPREIKVRPRYLYRGQGRQVAAQLEATNDRASGLGEPLPAGRVRFYEADAAGDLQFIGETQIGHTPSDEKVTLDVGVAFDLVGERRDLYRRRIAEREHEHAVEIELRNRKKTAVEIVVEERVSGDIEVIKKSHDFERKDANTLVFKIPVAAGKTVTVSYTARMRF